MDNIHVTPAPARRGRLIAAAVGMLAVLGVSACGASTAGPVAAPARAESASVRETPYPVKVADDDAVALVTYLADNATTLMDNVVDFSEAAVWSIESGDIESGAMFSYAIADTYTELGDVVADAPGQDTAEAELFAATFETCRDAYTASGNALTLLDVDEIDEAAVMINDCNVMVDASAQATTNLAAGR